MQHAGRIQASTVVSELMTVPTSSDFPASKCAGLQASTANEEKDHLLRTVQKTLSSVLMFREQLWRAGSLEHAHLFTQMSKNQLFLSTLLSLQAVCLDYVKICL